MDVLRRVNISCAWSSAFEIQILEQFIDLLIFGVRNIEFSVAHLPWVFHQKRWVTRKRLVEQIKVGRHFMSDEQPGFSQVGKHLNLNFQLSGIGSRALACQPY